ncbi:Uncharacterised protein [Shigella sonnei]|nr:Uncharacterised protein [Shigella sonnei]
MTVFTTDRKLTYRVLRCVHVVGGVASLCTTGGLRTVTHCDTVCMVCACVTADSNAVDRIS